MSSVTSAGIVTTVPEDVAKLLLTSLRMTTEGEISFQNIEVLLNWVEAIQQDLVQGIEKLVVPDELRSRVELLDDVLTLNKLPFINPDGSLGFITLQEYEYATGQCSDCSLTHCAYYIKAHAKLN